ncbi:hypothetical protein LTR28_009474 [Elasticomyces elasticus]|nr:hypothetical protein LTR28_009474 [Elasticomyces elasticus]
MASASGADHAVNSRKQQDYLAQIHEFTGGGCDGAPATLRVAGHLVVVGISKDDIQISAFDLAMCRKPH